MKRQPRIFLGPIEIAGYYTALETGLRDLGLDAWAIDLEPHPFRYRSQQRDEPAIVRVVYRVRDRRPGVAVPSPLRTLWKLAWVASRVLLLLWAAVRFDVFVFSAGVTVLRGRELPLLRLLGKRLIFVFHGSDARPAYIDGQLMSADRGVTIQECIAWARRRKERIRHIERYADVVVAQPAFSHFFERPVVNWFAIGVPWRDRPDAAPGEGNRDQRGRVRILHSPSDIAIKGSDRIREAVAHLTAEGLPLDLVELRGVSNDVVLEELGNADFVIDQLYSDAPMVGFATEAAVASKPAIVGSYAWEANRLAFGDVPFPPVEECEPDEILNAVRRLAMDAAHREALGREACAFVHEHWSRSVIAQRMLRLMEGPPPPEWMFNPRRLRYVEGCGLTREQVRDIVGALIREGGTAALCLPDKPDLEAAFVAFAAGDEH